MGPSPHYRQKVKGEKTLTCDFKVVNDNNDGCICKEGYHYNMENNCILSSCKEDEYLMS